MRSAPGQMGAAGRHPAYDARMSKLAYLLVAAALVACGGSSSSPDAPVSHDAPGRDAPGADAAQSTVKVVADCTGVAATDIGTSITTSGDTFSPSTATIAAGKYVKFTSTGPHNFQNQTGAPTNATFNSGTPGPHTACLQFTVAGSYPFECVVHVNMGMTGTLTVQ